MESLGDVQEVFGPPPRYPLESVDNALRLLSLFRVHDRIRVKDAADLLDVSTGTAHRLLAMLVYRRYVTQDPVSKLYLPGVMLLSIGLQAVRRSDLRQAAEPYLDELNARMDETVSLATLEGTEVFYVDGRESSHTLRIVSRAGTLQPAHCTSVGKALLARLSREHILRLYPDERLPRVTPSSISSRSQLLIELEGTRTRGYAVNFGELEEGIGSVAVTIQDRDGATVAALGIGAPTSRLDDVRLQELAVAVGEVAVKLGAALQG